MYTIHYNVNDELMLYKHEDCETDIHQLCQEFIRDHDFEGRGGEYIVRSNSSAVIAFY